MHARTCYVKELQEVREGLNALTQKQSEHLKTVVSEEVLKESQTKQKKKGVLFRVFRED